MTVRTSAVRWRGLRGFLRIGHAISDDIYTRLWVAAVSSNMRGDLVQ